MPKPEALCAARERWRALLGEHGVLDAEAAQAAYGADTLGVERAIGGALRLREAAQVAPVVRIAAEFGVALHPISTGRNWGYGSALPVCAQAVILDLSGLQRILDFDAELGVVTLEPGVTQAMLGEFLDRERHPFLVPVTGAGPQCSLIGNALERGYGITPQADHVGALTDLEAVLADGSRYRTALREAGGEDLARLHRWGIGPYSTGLFTQSGLGIVTRASLLLARRPERIEALFFGLREERLLEPAVERLRGLLQRLPGLLGGVNLMNRRRVLAMTAPRPGAGLDAMGLMTERQLAELGRQYQVAPWTGFATLYGSRALVRAAHGEIRQALRGLASRLVFLAPERATRLAQLARALPGGGGRRLATTLGTLARSLELVAGRPNETALALCYWGHPGAPRGPGLDPARDGCGLRWYSPLVPMRPAQVRAYVDMVERVASAHGIEPLITLTSLGERLFDSTVPLLFRLDRPEACAAAARCHAELLEAGRELGCFPYRVGIDGMADLLARQQDARRFQARLRAAFDPQGILAPGRYADVPGTGETES